MEQIKRWISTAKRKGKLLASLKDKEYEINEVKKGERIKKAPLPFYYKYLTAGSSQDLKLFHTEDNASGTAAV